jgi:hypothetical protein
MFKVAMMAGFLERGPDASGKPMGFASAHPSYQLSSGFFLVDGSCNHLLQWSDSK